MMTKVLKNLNQGHHRSQWAKKSICVIKCNYGIYHIIIHHRRLTVGNGDPIALRMLRLSTQQHKQTTRTHTQQIFSEH